MNSKLLLKIKEWFNRQVPPNEELPRSVDLVTSEEGFRFEGIEYRWDSIHWIGLSLHDVFAYDLIEIVLDFGEQQIHISEGFKEFGEFANMLLLKFPQVQESFQFLSHNAFSTETFFFEIQPVQNEFEPK